MDNAAATKYPLLDVANAEAIYTYVNNGEAPLERAPQLLAEVNAEIEKAFSDDVFSGSLEDSAALSYFFLSREALRRMLGNAPSSKDYYHVASLGAITGQPSLINIGYSYLAEDSLNDGDLAGAEAFIAKISDSDMATALEQRLTAKADPRADLRERLAVAKSGDVAAHGAEFRAINEAAQGLEHDEESLRMVLDSAVGFLYASADAGAREEVARTSHEYLDAARPSSMHSSLPAALLGRFYQDAAAGQVSSATRLSFLDLAADFYGEAGNPGKEVDLLLARVMEYLEMQRTEDAHDLLGSYYVKAKNSGSLLARARWIAFFSETLRTVSQSMAKSTQVLLDFMATNPVQAASAPEEFSAVATVAELLGDRYATAGDTGNSRRNYGIAYELFSSAGNAQALASLRAKA